MIHPHDVIGAARRFLGAPFAHQGRSEAGLDCLGLLLVVADTLQLQFEQQAVSAIDVPNYGHRPDVIFLRKRLNHFLHEIDAAAAAPADVVLLKVNGSPQHLAILSDYPMAGERGMIHAYAPARKVIEHRYAPDWQRATYAAFRLPQLYA